MLSLLYHTIARLSSLFRYSVSICLDAYSLAASCPLDCNMRLSLFFSRVFMARYKAHLSLLRPYLRSPPLFLAAYAFGINHLLDEN